MLVGQELEEFKKDLFDQFLSTGGYTAKEAEKLIMECVANLDKTTQLNKTIKVPRIIPFRYLEDEHEALSEKAFNELLFQNGFDTRNFKWFIDVCCYTWNNKMECGRIIKCSERLDREWQSSGFMSEDALSHVMKDRYDYEPEYLDE